MNSRDGALDFEARISLDKMKSDMALLKNEFTKMRKGAEVEGKKTQNVLSNLAKGAAAYFSVRQAAQFSRQIIAIRGEFQQLNIAFETMLGNKEKADKLMKDVVSFAAVTPFQLTDVANGTKQLLAYGIEAENIIPTLKALGDVSSGLNVPMNRLILNYGQVRTQTKLTGRELRDFTLAGVPIIAELSKALNKSERDIQEMVSVGKIGFKDVEKAFVTMTSEGGRFENLMDKQSKTITGRISNLQDAIDVMFNNIGQQNEGIINDAISGANYLVENYEEVGRVIGDLIIIYGTYRTALMVVAAAQGLVAASATAGVYLEMTASLGKVTLAHKARAVAIGIETAAQSALNAVVSANPYTIAAIALSGLVYAVYKYNTAATLAEDIQEKLNKAQEEKIKQDEKERESVNKSIKTIKDETSTRTEKQKEIDLLQSKYPNIFKNLDLESVKNLKNADALKKVNEELEKRNKLEDENKLGRLQSNLKALEDNRLEELRPKTLNSSGQTEARLYKNRVDALKEEIKQTKIKISENDRLAFNALSNGDKIAKKRKENQFLQSQSDSIGSRISSPFDPLNHDKQAIDKTIADNNKLIAEWEKSLNNVKPLRSQKDVLNDIKTTQKQINAFRKQSITGLSDIDKQNLEDAVKNLDEFKKELELLQGETVKVKEKKELDTNKKIEDATYQSELLKLQMQEDSSEKSLALLKLEGERRLTELKRQKEDTVKELTDGGESESKIKAFSDAYDSTIKAQQDVNKANLDAFLKEQLDAYKTFEEQKAQLQSDANKQIEFYQSQGTSEGDPDKYLGKIKEVRKELSAALFELEKTKGDNVISELFSDTSRMTSQELENLVIRAEEFYQSIPDKDKNTTKFKDIRKRIDEVKEKLLEVKPLFDEIAENIDIIFNPKSSEGDINKAIKQLIQNVNEAKEAVDFLGNAFSNLGDSFGSEALSNIGSVLSDIGNVIGETTQGAQIGDKLVPGGIGAAVGGAIGFVSSIGSAISKWIDKGQEREIQKLQDRINALTSAYESLERAISKAYGASAANLIKQENENLIQQRALIQKQIQEEQVKKKTDQSRIDSWKDAIKQIDLALEDNKDKAIEVIIGTSVKSAIEEFAQAYLDAWSAGEDKAAAIGDVVKNMIKTAISTFAKDQISDEVEKFSEKLADAMLDGVLTSAERLSLDALEQDINNKLNGFDGSLDQYIKDKENERTASSKGFGSMSQDSSDELNGRFTVMTEHTNSIMESSKVMVAELKMHTANNTQQLKRLAGIETNTSHLEGIKNDISSVKSGIDSINTTGVKIR